MYDINVVIVNWKAREEVGVCLRSLFKDMKDTELRAVIHVVDNSRNSDGIKELLEKEYPEVRYIDPGNNLGFGRAQNLGLKKEKARFYLPLNPDIEFPSKGRTLERLIDFLESRSDGGMAAPKLLNSDGDLQYSCYRFPALFDQIGRRLSWDKKTNYFRNRMEYYLMKDFDHNSVAPVDWVMGSFMLVKGEAARSSGFFDDRFFMYFEDCDWCRRMWEGGWKVYYAPHIQVKHIHHRDSAAVSPVRSLFNNSLARAHLKSWLKYFWKWKGKRRHYGM